MGALIVRAHEIRCYHVLIVGAKYARGSKAGGRVIKMGLTREEALKIMGLEEGEGEQSAQADPACIDSSPW